MYEKNYVKLNETYVNNDMKIGSCNNFSTSKISKGRRVCRNLGKKGKLPYSPQLTGFITQKEIGFFSCLNWGFSRSNWWKRFGLVNLIFDR